MKVLLVEPPYKRILPPLSLMKFSSYHKNRGDRVKFFRGEPWFQNWNPDRVYVTSVFTWDIYKVINTVKACQFAFPKADIRVGGLAATVMADKIKNATGISPHLGLSKLVEDCRPDYSLFPDLPYSLVTTTRGCPRGCGWCFVKTIEPEFYEKSDWLSQVDMSKKRIQFMDNNFLASSQQHIKSVFKKLRKLEKWYDFNQAIDCRLFTDKIARYMARTKPELVRFSFDTMGVADAAVKAVETCEKHGLNHIMFFILYNWKFHNKARDSPADMFNRMLTLFKASKNNSVRIFPMYYRSPTDTLKNIRGNGEWSTKQVLNFRRCLGGYHPYPYGLVIPVGGNPRENLKIFHKVFGRTGEEFTERMRHKPRRVSVGRPQQDETPFLTESR